MDILIAIGIGFLLSIDCFFILTLYCCSSKNNKLIPFLVGTFHIIFPIIMYNVSLTINQNINFTHMKLIPTVAVGYLGINQLLKKPTTSVNPARNGLLTAILISVSVSIDSLFIGFSLAYTNVNIYVYAISFGIVSFAIALLSVIIGKKIRDHINFDVSKICGVIFILLALMFFFEVI